MTSASNDDSTPLTSPPLFDALLVVSFGGPEGPDDVMPFLENVVRGRNIPRERLEGVAHHYALFGGVSPINDQTRALIAALRAELAAQGQALPIYWGNRNWHPFLEDTMRQMTADGVRHALALFTSGYSSYSSCRQYREDVARAQDAVGSNAPRVSLLRKFFNHPGFIEANADHLRAALDAIPAERRASAPIAFTAHSIPLGMAQASRYEQQLRETARLVAERLDHPNWQLVYQSRSGPPSQPWLDPDILDHLRDLKTRGTQDVVVAPIGFISDHVEVLYDLDVEARQLAAELDLNLVRAATAGVHPAFISMLRELIVERTDPTAEKRSLGSLGPSLDLCTADCCLPAPGQPPRARAI